MSAQLQLPKLKDPRIRAPMVDIAGAFAVLDGATEREICTLIDLGYLWAWNIGSESAKRPELRILAKSIAVLADTWRDSLESTAPAIRYPIQWDQVLEILLPGHDKPFFTAREVKRALNCRRQHFINLVAAKVLPGTDYRQGPGGSPCIARDALIAFLETRCIGGI